MKIVFLVGSRGGLFKEVKLFREILLMFDKRFWLFYKNIVYYLRIIVIIISNLYFDDEYYWVIF